MPAVNVGFALHQPVAFGWVDFGHELVRQKVYGAPLRNYTARLNLRAMSVGDAVFFYHSNIGVEIVGIAKVSKGPFQDPTDDTGRWTSVKVKPVKKLKQPVTLKEIKADPALADMELLTKFRLSVSEVRESEWEHILSLAAK
ncbi:MAG: EVE domain-containing protein [Novosphingobium sp.]